MAASHELIEALTDPLVTTGWRDSSQPAACGGEVADMCTGRPFYISKTISGATVTMKVQQMYSNLSASCQLDTPGAPLDQSGYDTGTSFALAGDLTDTSGIPIVTNNGRLSATLVLADSTTISVSDPTFLTTWQKQSNAHAMYGDFNGDGLADVALTGVSGWATIPLAAGGVYPLTVTNAGVTKANVAPSSYLADGANFPLLVTQGWETPVVGDFNGDGRSDIAFVGAYSQVSPYGVLGTIPIAYGSNLFGGYWWSTNRSDGGLSALLDSAANSVHVVPGDYNRDGRTDIALVGSQGGNAWNYIAVGLSNGDGTFAAVKKFSLPSFASLAASQYTVQTLGGDFNGDGLADIALIGAELGSAAWTSVPIALGAADGSFTMVNSTGGDNTAIQAAAAQPLMRAVGGDFDGDGITDFALFGPSSWTTPVYAMSSGDGTFKKLGASAVQSSFMALASRIAVTGISASQDLYREAD